MELCTRFRALAGALLVSICVLSWLVPLVAILMQVESPGPVFHKQLWLTAKGQPVYCYTFRRLYLHKQLMRRSAGATRLTQVGALIHALRVNTLLRCINVLRGEVALTGPDSLLPLNEAAWSKTRSSSHANQRSA
jgi:putative colanic acid biosynthesis UDP-glucose lipid carrier transferase